ncbi:MAG: SDR family oxidoreductase [Elusimicrobiota bacterium]
MKLKNYGILIAGASQGLGKAIARACVSEGAHVFLGARDARLLGQTRAELERQAKAGQKVLAAPLDVSKPDLVKQWVNSARTALPSLDGLVNNAGVYGPKGFIDEVNWSEWVEAVQINLFGTALLCRTVLPIFKNQKRGKIVNLSGGGATAPLPYLSAYAVSKAAVVRLTDTLAEETKGLNIDINAIAPGRLNTRLLEEVIVAGPDKVGHEFYERSLRQKSEGGTPLDKGAALCVFLLSNASDGISGRLISAVWDPWPKLEQYRPELIASDIYTLRRIVPEDRGKNWE